MCDVIVMLTLCGDANCRMRLPRQPQHLAYASSQVQSVNQGIISPVRLPRQPQRANQFAQFVGWGGDIIIGIICVLRPWFDCIDRHVYLLPLRDSEDSEIRRDLKRQSDSQRPRLCLALQRNIEG